MTSKIPLLLQILAYKINKIKLFISKDTFYSGLALEPPKNIAVDYEVYNEDLTAIITWDNADVKLDDEQLKERVATKIL